MCLSSGELQSVDGYMNIALEKCEEHVNGVKKRSYGDAFVRGNNGKFVLEYWDMLRNLG
jgi:U6 snRNA-associated Sm-like protein LSm6